jgi:hypothetical protein
MPPARCASICDKLVIQGANASPYESDLAVKCDQADAEWRETPSGGGLFSYWRVRVAAAGSDGFRQVNNRFRL